MEINDQYLDDVVDEIRFRYFSGIEDYGTKIDFDYLPSPEHHVRFGATIHIILFAGSMGVV